MPCRDTHENENIGTAVRQHHPGGQLGRRLLLTVGDVMKKDGDNQIIRRSSG
jgi:hypothetical protein